MLVIKKRKITWKWLRGLAWSVPLTVIHGARTPGTRICSPYTKTWTREMEGFKKAFVSPFSTIQSFSKLRSHGGHRKKQDCGSLLGLSLNNDTSGWFSDTSAFWLEFSSGCYISVTLCWWIIGPRSTFGWFITVMRHHNPICHLWSYFQPFVFIQIFHGKQTCWRAVGLLW